MQSPISIPLHKRQYPFLIAGSIILALASIYIFNLSGSTTLSPSLVRTLGGIGFFGFAIAAAYMSKQYLDKKPGLVIDSKGILDNTSGIREHRIEWKDILGFEQLIQHQKRLILVKVRRPQKYIDQGTNHAQKRLLRLNLEEYGTPIYINVGALKMEVEELVKLLIEQQQKRKRKGR